MRPKKPASDRKPLLRAGRRGGNGGGRRGRGGEPGTPRPDGRDPPGAAPLRAPRPAQLLRLAEEHVEGVGAGPPVGAARPVEDEGDQLGNGMGVPDPGKGPAGGPRRSTQPGPEDPRRAASGGARDLPAPPAPGPARRGCGRRGPGGPGSAPGPARARGAGPAPPEGSERPQRRPPPPRAGRLPRSAGRGRGGQAPGPRRGPGPGRPPPGRRPRALGRGEPPLRPLVEGLPEDGVEGGREAGPERGHGDQEVGAGHLLNGLRVERAPSRQGLVAQDPPGRTGPPGWTRDGSTPARAPCSQQTERHPGQGPRQPDRAEEGHRRLGKSATRGVSSSRGPPAAPCGRDPRPGDASRTSGPEPGGAPRMMVSCARLRPVDKGRVPQRYGHLPGSGSGSASSDLATPKSRSLGHSGPPPADDHDVLGLRMPGGRSPARGPPSGPSHTFSRKGTNH